MSTTLARPEASDSASPVTVTPTGDFVLVKPESVAEFMTDGGIVVPQSSHDVVAYGRVLSVGPKVEGVAEGTVVAFVDQYGYQVQTHGLLVRESDIIAVITR